MNLTHSPTRNPMCAIMRVIVQRWAFIGLLFCLLSLIAMPMPSYAQTANSHDSTASVNKRVPMSHLYIALSDAMAASKAGQTEQAKTQLIQLQTEWNNISERQSAKGQAANQALMQAIENPNAEQLSALSNALYAFEQEQNPVDYSAKRQAFKKQILPALAQLEQAIAQAQANDTAALSTAYQQFNAAWLGNERVVRNTSMGHYGQIETAMALMRVALETTPLDLDKVRLQSQNLKSAIDSYNRGETVATQASAYDFNGGVQW